MNETLENLKHELTRLSPDTPAAQIAGRAISLAETYLKIGRQLTDHVQSFSKLSTERTYERDQARADVLKLRDVIQFEVFQDHIPNDPDTDKVWANTEHYEQYR